MLALLSGYVIPPAYVPLQFLHDDLSLSLLRHCIYAFSVDITKHFQYCLLHLLLGSQFTSEVSFDQLHFLVVEEVVNHKFVDLI